MNTQGANGVGRFSVDFEVANNDDLALLRRGLLRANQVRRRTIAGVVDPGPAMLVLPEAVVKQLGLPLDGKIKVRYADGRGLSAARLRGFTSSCLAAIPSSTRSSNPSAILL